MVGATVSMLMPPTVALAVLPALSLALPLTDCAAPSPLSVVGAGHEATPDKLSRQSKLAVTATLFQPPALAAGARMLIIPGAGLLSLMPCAFYEDAFAAWSIGVA